MLFYLVWFKKMDKFVAYILENSKIDECAEVVCLYNIVHEIKAERVYNTKLDLIEVGLEIKNESFK